MVALYVAERTPLGAALRRFRTRAGLTMTALAELSHVPRPYISMLESGERKNPSFQVMEPLAAAVGVTVGDFYREAGRAFPNGEDESVTVHVDNPVKASPMRQIGRFRPDVIEFLVDIGRQLERRGMSIFLEPDTGRKPAEDEAGDEPQIDEPQPEP